MRLKRSQACRMGVDDKKEENMRKGPWTFGEDMKLIAYIRMNGAGRWNSVAKAAGLKRSGKSCRMRWLNYLRPDLKRGSITPKEQSLIFDLHRQWGNRWSRIARSLPGRTDNEIKNHWRTHIKKISRELVQSYRWPPASKTHSQIKAVRENNLCSSGKSFNGVRKECYAEFIAPKTLNKVGCDLCEVDDGNLESLTNQNKHQECIKKFSDMNTRSCMEAETYETSIAQYSPVCSCLSAIASQENVFSDSEDFLWDYNSIALWNLDDVCLPNVNEVIDL